MASGFELRVAAANAIASIEYLRQFVGPNVDAVKARFDSAAFDHVNSYLTGIIAEPEFISEERNVILAAARRENDGPPVLRPSPAAENDEVHCSFCSVESRYATALVRGQTFVQPDAYICDGCVVLAAQIVDDHKRTHPLKRSADAARREEKGPF